MNSAVGIIARRFLTAVGGTVVTLAVAGTALVALARVNRLAGAAPRRRPAGVGT